MWNLKFTIIPVIIGATGIVTRSLRKNLEAVPRKHSIGSLQKTAILETSHIIRKVLQCEAWSVSVGDHCWFERSAGKKRTETETFISYNNINNDNNNNNNNNNECGASHYSPRIFLAEAVLQRSGFDPKPVRVRLWHWDRIFAGYLSYPSQYHSFPAHHTVHQYR